MNLQVFNEEGKDLPVTLKLREMLAGVDVVVVNDEGSILNTLLRFNTDGTITLAAFVSTKYGFKQRDDGSIFIKGSKY